jgi:hypothetical protein
MDRDDANMHDNRGIGGPIRHARWLLGLIAAAVTLALTAAPAAAESAHFVPTFTCTGVTIDLAGFPEAVGNKVTEVIAIDHSTRITETFVFNGSSASNTIPLHLAPGHYQLDARVSWKGAGKHDQPLVGGITCAPEPKFTIEKLQAAGRKGLYTKTLLYGTRRELIRYEVIVRNTGTVPLAIGPLQDANCDAGTITGGPGGALLEAGEATIFYCSHLLTNADQDAGVYENVASVTATPPAGDGPPITEPSNPVIVELPHDTVGFGCEAILFSFFGFPNLPGNMVEEIVTINHEQRIYNDFSFNGPSGSNVVTLSLPPGHYKLDAWARWNTNGVKGARDEHLGGNIRCTAPPEE